jgi:hypothetical protein
VIAVTWLQGGSVVLDDVPAAQCGYNSVLLVLLVVCMCLSCSALGVVMENDASL